jgi:septal ring factor EnvC (AmiA/AmiB activator)
MINMLDAITQYILALVPAVTALVGMAVCVGVGIGKIRKANQDTVDSIDRVGKRSQSLEDQLKEVQAENIQLKRDLRKVMAKLEHVHFVDDKEE